MEADTLELIFVGTGVSCAIPVIGHIGSRMNCCCEDAARNALSPNRRNNVSLLFSLFKNFSTLSNPVSAPKGGDTVGEEKPNGSTTLKVNAEPEWRILIDCGKTFRNAYFRVLASRGIRYVDALLITHGHADAMNGIEELCDVHTAALQECRRGNHCSTKISKSRDPIVAHSGDIQTESSTFFKPSVWRISTYLSTATLKEIQSAFPEYLLPRPEGRNKNETAEPSSCSTNFNTIVEARLQPYLLRDDCVSLMNDPSSYLTEEGYEDGSKDLPHDFPLYAVPVEHGQNYMCFGFVFGRGTKFRCSSVCSEDAMHKLAFENVKEDARSPLDENTAACRTSVNNLANSALASCVVYLSDVSEIPPFAYDFLKNLVQIDILIIDLLAEHGSSSPSHYCWDDVWPVIHSLHPKKVYCVGMFCSIDHHQANRMWCEELQKEKEMVQKALLLGEWNNDPRKKAWKQHFLNTVESIELAYDGLTLTTPA